MKSQFTKRVISLTMAICLLTTNTYFPLSINTYALENAAAQTDFSKAEDLDISGASDYIIKLPAGTTKTYNNIYLSKNVTIKGTDTPVITGYQRSEMPILRCLNKMSITDKSDAHFSIIYPKRLLAFVKD